MVKLFHRWNMPSNTKSGADNQQERLEPYWVVGFVDGEGCFSISCNRNDTTKLGYQIFPEFVVTQGAKSLVTLKRIQSFFGCGRIFINRRNDNHREPIYRYCVRAIGDLTIYIIPFFQRSPLQTAKQKDFQFFCEAIQIMQRGDHLKRTGVRKILRLKSQMNRKKVVRLENPQRLHARSATGGKI